jgi:hypothetical protein
MAMNPELKRQLRSILRMTGIALFVLLGWFVKAIGFLTNSTLSYQGFMRDEKNKE